MEALAAFTMSSTADPWIALLGEDLRGRVQDALARGLLALRGGFELADSLYLHSCLQTDWSV